MGGIEFGIVVIWFLRKYIKKKGAWLNQAPFFIQF